AGFSNVNPGQNNGGFSPRDGVSNPGYSNNAGPNAVYGNNSSSNMQNRDAQYAPTNGGRPYQNRDGPGPIPNRDYQNSYVPPPPPPPVAAEATKDAAEEKPLVPHGDDKVDDSKALAVVHKDPESAGKSAGGSHDRDKALGQLETEKRLSLIKAWEESEKAKAENKSQKTLANIEAWENTKKANIESQLKAIEEKLEKKKAEYREKMQNKIAMIHKEADEKKAMVEAKRGEELLKAEEVAAKYRATNSAPKKLIGCFGY
ncbi:hypothetical protein, partial [Ralstonia pseudosolanacearum]|uniref:hypothetical protein n=1 Tax=Ralstonia pseudosolanacearum TaxID=1310165 RepID=UPI003CE71E2F